MRRILWYIKQLLPFIYRTHYWDSMQRLHFSVWRQWFGICFACDDVVVVYDSEMERRCAEALENEDYKTLERLSAELKRRRQTKRAQLKASLQATDKTGSEIADETDEPLEQFEPVADPAPAEKMQTITLPEGEWDSKPVLILPRYRSITLGALSLKTPDDRGEVKTEVVEVGEVRHKQFIDLDDDEVEDSGAFSDSGVLAALRRISPSFLEDDEITVLFFRM